jgi:hypothetical protein
MMTGSDKLLDWPLKYTNDVDPNRRFYRFKQQQQRNDGERKVSSKTGKFPVSPRG